MSAVLAEMHDRADALLEQQARQELADDLKAGKKVNGCDLYDCLDSFVNGTPEEYKSLLTDITGLLLDDGEREYNADTLMAKVIGRYLDTGLGQDAIQERIRDIEEERE